MITDQHKRCIQFLVALVFCLSFAGSGLGWAALPPAQFAKSRRIEAPPPAPVPLAGIPSDVQLLNDDTDPTLRFPVGHSSLNWTLMKPRIIVLRMVGNHSQRRPLQLRPAITEHQGTRRIV